MQLLTTISWHKYKKRRMKSSYTMILSLLLVITSIAVTVNAQCTPCISSATPCYDTVGKCYPKLEMGKHGGGGCPALTTLCENIYDSLSNTMSDGKYTQRLHSNVNLASVEEIRALDASQAPSAINEIHGEYLELKNCMGEFFSSIMTTTFTAPTTGDYKFLLTADDFAELTVDGHKACGFTSKTKALRWNKPGQKSDAFSFVEGQRVALEIVHAQRWKACHMKVGVILPGGSWVNPLPRSYFGIGTGDDGSVPPTSVRPTEVVKSLRVTEMVSNSVRLQWIAPDNVPVGWRIDGYDIYIAHTASPSPGDFNLLGSTTASSIKPPRLFQDGVDYYLAVRVKYTSIAGSDVEFSDYATVSFTYTMQPNEPTDTVPTGIPSEIMFSEKSDSGVRVMWLAPAEATPSPYILMYKIALAIGNGFNLSFSPGIYKAATTTVYDGLVADTSYTVRIQARYIYVVDNSEVYTAPIFANFNTLEASSEAGPGEVYGLVHDIFTSLRGNITMLQMDDRFVNDNPTSSEVVQSAFSFDDLGDFYGQRFRGLYIAPATGVYIFAISANNYAELFFSTDSTAANQRKIAEVKSWTDFGEYTKFPEQTSDEIQLIVGERYYIEALHVELNGVGHIRVKVTTPSGAVFDPIRSNSLIADTGIPVEPPVTTNIPSTAPVAPTTTTTTSPPSTVGYVPNFDVVDVESTSFVVTYGAVTNPPSGYIISYEFEYTFDEAVSEGSDWYFFTIRKEVGSGRLVVAGVNPERTYGIRVRAIAKDENDEQRIDGPWTSKQFTTPPAPTPEPTNPQFHIELRYLQSNVLPEIRSAFDNAAARWSEVIIGDLENINFKKKQTSCGMSFSAGDVVDDIVITVNLTKMDGPFGILGSAGPCGVRQDGSPWSGSMNFDTDDLEIMIARNMLISLILHEMGHVIGIGTLWDWGSINGLLVDGDTNNPYYDGSFGKQGLEKIGGSGNPLVEGSGGAGTRNSHWRESKYENELMTGYLSGSTQPMSSLTVLSLKDLGFIVNENAADAFTVPTTSSTTRLLRRNLADNMIEFGADTLGYDVIVTDAYGTVQEIMPVDGDISDMEQSAEEIAELAGVSPDFTTTPKTNTTNNDYLAIIGVVSAGCVVGFIVIAAVFMVATKTRNTDAAARGGSRQTYL